jgi:hypothetical protein
VHPVVLAQCHATDEVDVVFETIVELALGSLAADIENSYPSRNGKVSINCIVSFQEGVCENTRGGRNTIKMCHTGTTTTT